MRIKGMS